MAADEAAKQKNLFYSRMTADKAVKRKTNCKNSRFWYFMFALEIISVEVFNIFVFGIEFISAGTRRMSTLAFLNDIRTFFK